MWFISTNAVGNILARFQECHWKYGICCHFLFRWTPCPWAVQSESQSCIPLGEDSNIWFPFSLLQYQYISWRAAMYAAIWPNLVPKHLFLLFNGSSRPWPAKAGVITIHTPWTIGDRGEEHYNIVGQCILESTHDIMALSYLFTWTSHINNTL